MPTVEGAAAPLIAPDTRVGRSSVVVALGFLLGTALSGLLGILIGLVLGEGADTDAFLAAYSIYLVFLLFGANLRVALLPLLGAADDETRLRARAEDVLGRMGAVGIGVAAILLLGAPLGAWLLTAGAENGGFATAALTLVILAPAALCQVIGAAQSSALAAGRRFNVSAGLYVASSAVTVLLASALMVLFGALGASAGVLGGAAALALGHAVYLRRFALAGHPRPRLLRERATFRMAGAALAGAALPLAFQSNLTIALAAVSGAVGTVTAYTYGYFLPVLLTSLAGASIGFVSMPGLVENLQRRGPVAASEYVRVFAPLGAFLYVPLAAAIAALGLPVIEAVLEGPLTPATVDLLWDVLLTFLVMGVAWVLAAPVSSAALALGRYRGLGVIAAASLPVQAVCVWIADAAGGPRAAAIAHAAVGVAIVVAVFIDVFRGAAAREAGVMLYRSLPAGLLALVFPAVALITPDGWFAHVVAAMVGLVAYLALTLALWGDVRRALLGIVKG